MNFRSVKANLDPKMSNSQTQESHVRTGTAVVRLVVAMAAILLPIRLHAQQTLFPVDFSAEKFVYEKAHPEQVMMIGKVYAGQGRLRQEMHPPKGPQIVYIIDPAGGHMWQMMPDRKTAIDMGEAFRKMGEMMGASKGMMQTLKPTNTSKPCGDSKYVTCEKVGTEVVNGRSTQKWEFTHTGMGKTSKSYQWIDPKLYIAVKEENDSSVTELRNIKEGSQPADLFEVPADYHKMTSQDMQPGGKNPQ